MGETAKIKRSNSRLLRYLPILFILGIWLIFAHPYFIKNLVPFPSRYLVDFFPPWNNFYGMAVSNNAMPDVITQLYPWKHLVIESWKAGELPKWNPYQFAGNPLLANYQSGAFAPINVLFFILPFIDAWSISVLLQPLLAGLFMYLFCRSLSISKSGSLIASISFMFCGFMTVWMAYGTLGHALLYVPLLLYGITTYFKKTSTVSAIIILLTIPFSFFSGHFQTSLYFFGVGLLYLLYQTISSREIKRGSMVLLFMISGIIISLPQLLPSYALFQQSVRSNYFQGIGGMPWQNLITIFAPDFFGNPVTRNDWHGYYAEWMAFSSGAAVVLALVAVVYKRKKNPVLFFILLAALSLIGSIQSPVLALIGNLHLPLISTIGASRMIVLFSFSGAVLAGFGVDSMKELLSDKKLDRRILVALAIPVGIVLFVWFLLLQKNIVFIATDFPNALSIAKKNFILPTGVILATIVLVLSVKLLPKKIAQVIPAVFILILSFDMLRFSMKWMPFDEREFVYPSIPVLEFLKEHTTHERVFQNMYGEALMTFGLQGIEGYDPLYIQRYGELARSSANGEFIDAERSVVKVPQNSTYIHDYLDFTGVKYILHSKQDKKAEWIVPVWEFPDTYTLAYEDEYYEVYENLDAFPRSFIVHSFQVLPDQNEFIPALYSSIDQLRDLVFLEETPDIQQNKQDCGSTAQIESYSPNKVIIQTESECPGFLVLTDNYYPDWQVTVDGHQKKIYRADYTFRAVEIPSGTATINFFL